MNFKPFFSILCSFFVLTVTANNLRCISSREGISNNAVLSLCQDKNGYIWVGTCDGLNLWDGRSARLFPVDWGFDEGLSGNLIERITATSDGLFWIYTNYGLDLFDPATRKIERHPQFQGFFHYVTNSSEKVLVFTKDGSWFYYNPNQRTFAETEPPVKMADGDCLDMVLGHDDVLTFFTRDRILRFSVTFSGGGKPPVWKQLESITPPVRIEYAFDEESSGYLIGADHSLYEYNLATRELAHKANLSGKIESLGRISDIIRDEDDYLLSFYTNGVIRLRKQLLSDNPYVVEPLDISCGVFTLLRDQRQHIVWIGTDGHGLFQLSRDATTFRSLTYNELPIPLSTPIRALLVDRRGALWFATKGEGVVRIQEFYTQKKMEESHVEHYTSANSALLNNSVYALAESARNFFWVGGDGGLNYYSYADNRLHAIPADDRLGYIHALYESDPQTLWVATVGLGVFRLRISGSDNAPQIESIEPLNFGSTFNPEKNLFFTLYPENDRIIWFGNRGGGAVRYDTTSGLSQVYELGRNSNPLYNDIFTLCRTHDGRMWFGTGSGVICGTDEPRAIEGINGAVHGILEDNHGNLWVSTNRGLIKYKTDGAGIVNYGYSYGLQTIEYSDGAYYADRKRGTLLFGGIDGFVAVQESGDGEQPHNPPILFRDVKINDRIVAIQSVLTAQGVLSIKPGQRMFSITMSAPDYINGSNYTYYTRLDGYNDQWEVGSEQLSFADLPAGNYRLDVKYYNNATGQFSPTYSLGIRIMAPWYATHLAIAIYSLLSLGLISGSVYLFIRRYRRRRAERRRQLNALRKEQFYESKINLFSNLTQELSVPLTMISAPCQQILSLTSESTIVTQYARTIQQNVAKLQNLVSMLYQFRGQHHAGQPRMIELVGVSELGRQIADTFVDFAQQKGVECMLHIEPHLVWPSDKEGLSMILNTLLSNAFQHTPREGAVTLTICNDNEQLLISVANHSAGIDMESIRAIFDRYRVLDYFDKKSRRGLSISGDLGLAICHNMVEEMQGRIAVASNPDATVTFTVRLPRLTVSELSTSEPHIVSVAKEFGLPATPALSRRYDFDPQRQTMVVVNDNAEVMSFVAELFSPEFNIKIYDSAQEVADLLRQMHPDIIICDMLSHRSDNLSLIGQIKCSKLTSHIPIILLSTQQQVDDRIKGIESGADICLTLPFDVEYLKAVVNQLLRRGVQLKNYYKSSASAFEMVDGKMLHKDDKEFVDRLIGIINDNLSNSDISTKFIADQMGASVRNLYRRIEGILQQTPAAIIKEYRLTTAEHLLTTTKLSIDEIIYKAGFVNRGTFFRCFSAKYGCTPKVYRRQKLEGFEEEE